MIKKSKRKSASRNYLHDENKSSKSLKMHKSKKSASPMKIKKNDLNNKYLKFVESVWKIKEQFQAKKNIIISSFASNSQKNLHELWKWLKNHFDEYLDLKFSSQGLLKANSQMIKFIEQIKKELSEAINEMEESSEEDDNSLRHTAEEIHEMAANLLLLLAVLHVAGVVFESRAMRRNLVAPMLLGKGDRRS